MNLLSSALRSPGPAGADALVRLAADAEAEALFVDAPWTLDAMPVLVGAAAASGLRVGAAAAPLAPAPLAAGKRLPHLAAHHDRDERLAAIANVTTVLETASELGANALVVSLGTTSLAVRPRELSSTFARAALDEDDPRSPLARAVGERRALSPRLHDAARFSLERVLRAAEKTGARIALLLAALPWQVPTPREASDLLEAFAGAPLGVAFDPGRWAVLTRLQLAASEPRRMALVERSLFVHACDAVGLRADLAAGLGDADLTVARPSTGPLAADVIISGRLDTSAAELAAASQIARGWRS